MPQLDFSVYLSQIFWFALCFLSIYLAAYFIILPRLKNIIHNRDILIDSDLSMAKQLRIQIEEIEEKIREIKSNSANIYQTSIDNALKQAAKNREDSMTSLKNEIEEITKNSRRNLEKLVIDILNKSEDNIKEVSLAIKNKILN